MRFPIGPFPKNSGIFIFGFQKLTLSMTNSSVEERRSITDSAISPTDAANLALKTWMAMTSVSASRSNEQLGTAEPMRSPGLLRSLSPCLFFTRPNLIEESALLHLVEITRVDHFLRFDALCPWVHGRDFVQCRLKPLRLDR